MEKLKNLIHPGHKKDDEVMYGSGQSDDPVHTGHGHHTGKVEGNPITSNKTGADTGPSTGFSGYGNAPAPGSNRAPEDRALYEGSNTGATGGSSASRVPGGFDDAATTASVKSGIIGEPQSGSTMSGSNVQDPLNTNKALPHEPATAGAGGLTGTSLPDRSVGSSGLGQGSTSGSSHLGRDAALGAGVLGAGEAAHHHREKQEIGSGSGREFPLGGNSGYPSGSTGATNEPGLGATTGGYGSGTGPTASSANQGILGSTSSVGAYNEESWSHDHSHQFGGDPCGGAEAPAPGVPHFTPGPHALETANRLDPHVSGRIGEPTESATSGAGLGSTGSGTGLGSSSTDTGYGSTSSGNHHLGRDAALAGGAGAAGLGAYEAEKHHHGHGLTGTTSGSTSDPYSSSGVDSRMDPTSRSGALGATSTDRGTPGQVLYDSGRGPTTSGYDQPSSGTGLTSSTRDQQPMGSGHHLGRDAGLVGAGGVGAYEADKHLGKEHHSHGAHGTDPSAISTGQSTGHHLGRDAGLVGVGGVGAYEADKHLGKEHHPHGAHGADPSTSNTADVVVHRYERDAALGAGGAGVGAAAGSEFSKTAAEHDAKHNLKDQKHHQKELEKEQKHHHKEAEKVEHHDEKKHHGGILGLFKREKPDEELKRENLERKGEIPSGSQGQVPPGFTETRGHPGLSEYEQHERAGEHQGMSEADKLMMAREHDRNRLHKDPPPGYVEKKMEEQGQGHGLCGASAGGYETLPDGRVVEPHTGLPANLKKGDGMGGTDNTPVPGIHGHHY